MAIQLSLIATKWRLIGSAKRRKHFKVARRLRDKEYLQEDEEINLEAGILHLKCQHLTQRSPERASSTCSSTALKAALMAL
ncbi:unnamed protein product, partial [Brenthis ino]